VDTRGNIGPLIAVGGGALLFISLLLSWNADFSPWELFDLLDIILALIGLAAVVIAGAIALGRPLNVPGGPSNTIYTGAVFAFAIAALSVLEGEEVKFGAFVAVIGTIAMIVGALQIGRGATAGAESRTGPAEPRTRPTEPTPPTPPATPPSPPPPPASGV
jgi:hypothetical protein